jgi:glycosyltransferase involved in cell wall biosynthesis
MQPARTVDIVIPVFNEAATVRELCARLRAVCPEAQLVFVDNGSTDGTLEMLEKLPDVRLIRHVCDLGYGRSLLDGIAASNGERIVMIDADLEYFPEDVPAIVDALESAPAVYGSRFLGRAANRRVMPLFRRIGNGVVTGLFNLLFGQRLTDLYTGLRGVRRSTLPTDNLSRDGFEIVLELAALLSAAGHRIIEVPIRYEPRTAGRSKMRHIPEFLKFARVLVVLKLQLRGRSAEPKAKSSSNGAPARAEA